MVGSAAHQILCNWCINVVVTKGRDCLHCMDKIVWNYIWKVVKYVESNWAFHSIITIRGITVTIWLSHNIISKNVLSKFVLCAMGVRGWFPRSKLRGSETTLKGWGGERVLPIYRGFLDIGVPMEMNKMLRVSQ